MSRNEFLGCCQKQGSPQGTTLTDRQEPSLTIWRVAGVVGLQAAIGRQRPHSVVDVKSGCVEEVTEGLIQIRGESGDQAPVRRHSSYRICRAGRSIASGSMRLVTAPGKCGMSSSTPSRYTCTVRAACALHRPRMGKEPGTWSSAR